MSTSEVILVSGKEVTLKAGPGIENAVGCGVGLPCEGVD